MGPEDTVTCWKKLFEELAPIMMHHNLQTTAVEAAQRATDAADGVAFAIQNWDRPHLVRCPGPPAASGNNYGLPDGSGHFPALVLFWKVARIRGLGQDLGREAGLEKL
ncbi:hypothetical protein L211DRAFT_852982 [Terfezia boudieri ATCC MYA-4762]|uniref:Uncharacterized protein n=1 Tax=Terfezia boudieri ATCC MYA-4762 TaxID=1051890 RepID=A0A3N4LAL3_9PEZI|nr:hypothetical protein L211DRAFT_852982 [Terfezia boudieri ATCC MYA-4762]